MMHLARRGKSVAETAGRYAKGEQKREDKIGPKFLREVLALIESPECHNSFDTIRNDHFHIRCSFSEIHLG